MKHEEQKTNAQKSVIQGNDGMQTIIAKSFPAPAYQLVANTTTQLKTDEEKEEKPIQKMSLHESHGSDGLPNDSSTGANSSSNSGMFRGMTQLRSKNAVQFMAPKNGEISPYQFKDNRTETVTQRKIQDTINNSLQVNETAQLQAMANNFTSKQEPPFQRKESPDPIQKKNNTGLPDDLKSGMENLSGMSLDDVKVHRNSDKPAQLQAHAYAQGTDIHLGSGQEKHLPHELAHVVQQKQGRVKPTKQLKGKVNVNDDAGLEKEADVMGAKALQMKEDATLNPNTSSSSLSNIPIVQRKEQDVIVTGVSHLVEMKGSTLQGSDFGPVIIHGQELVIETESEILSRRGPNQEAINKEDPTKTNREVDEKGEHIYSWFEVVSIEGKSSKGMYIRKDVFKDVDKEKSKRNKAYYVSKSSEFADTVTAAPGALIGNEGITGVADALNGKTLFTNTSGAIPKLDENGNKVIGPDGKPETVNITSDSDREKAAIMGQAGDYMTGVTGILGMASGFAALGDPEAKTSDLILTAFNIEQGAMKTGEATSKLVHTYSKSDEPTTASQFGSTFESFGAAFSVIKEGFQGMQKLIKLINNNQDYSTVEKAKAAGEISKHALESAKGIVLSVKSIMELVNGSASGGLMASVPGLDIAISGVNMIMQGYYLHISNNSRKVMNDRRKKIREDKNLSKDELNNASEEYRKFDAEASNKKSLVKDYQKELSNKKIKQSRKTELDKRIKRLNSEIELLENHNVDKISREDVAEYTMATELRDVNKKRVVRQGIHLATEMAKIAGSIATLTGVGAMAGGVIKGAAAATDLALPAARMAKQKARDVKAKNNAKSKSKYEKDSKGNDVLNKDEIMKKGKFYNFDSSKSSMAKNDFRIKQVKHLIKMIVEAGYAYKQDKSTKAPLKKVSNYLKATGVSETKLFKNNGDPKKQIKILLDAFKQREL